MEIMIGGAKARIGVSESIHIVRILVPFAFSVVEIVVVFRVIDYLQVQNLASQVVRER